MKIFEVEIENYRQYKGTNSISFSIDPEKNFTIIEGDNGGGKSNLMNAINWCLYGDEMFKSKNNEGREIVNELALQELNDGDSTRAYVSLKIGESEIEFAVSREIEYTKYNSRIVSGLPQFKVVEISSQTGMKRNSNPEWFVEKRFIPKDLRGFFFFDGEKMDEYFEDTSKVKHNVQKIAQIDILQNSIDTLDATIRNINSEIKKQEPDSIIDLEHITNKKIEKEEAEKKKEETENEIIAVKSEIDEIENYLRNNSDVIVKKIQEYRDDLEKQRKEIISNQQSNENNIRALISSCAPILLSAQALTYSEKLIEEETQKGVLPPNIKDVFLKDLLDEGVCICGRELTEGSDSRLCVERLLNQLMPSDISCEATQGRFIIQNMLKKKDFVNKYRVLLEKKTEYEGALDELSKKIETESEKLTKYNLEDIRQKEKDRKMKNKVLGQLNTRKGALGNKIIQLDDKITQLNEQYSKYKTSNANINRLREQYNFAEELRTYFKNIKESILDDVRKQLEEKTRNYFFNMIWKKDAFSDVCINDLGNQYKISVLSEFGNECLGDLSAGERQVLALSFTAALYSVSGYSVPVIIDTPLGRISGIPRDNIASSLPNYLSETQVIMLATDTEYTNTVRDKLKVSVGAEYRIEHDTTTKTSKVISYD